MYGINLKNVDQKKVHPMMICTGYPDGCNDTDRRIIVSNNVLTLNYNSLKFSKSNNASRRDLKAPTNNSKSTEISSEFSLLALSCND